MQIYVKNKTSYHEFIVALGAGILLGLIHCLINFDDPPQKKVIITSLSDEKVCSEKQTNFPRILELVSGKDRIKTQVSLKPQLKNCPL